MALVDLTARELQRLLEWGNERSRGYSSELDMNIKERLRESLSQYPAVTCAKCGSVWQNGRCPIGCIS